MYTRKRASQYTENESTDPCMTGLWQAKLSKTLLPQQQQNWATTAWRRNRLRRFCKATMFAVLPTGYGKSLWFGCLPFAFDKLLDINTSIVVVETPLTAIMKDQVSPREDYTGCSQCWTYFAMSQFNVCRLHLCRLQVFLPEDYLLHTSQENLEMKTWKRGYGEASIVWCFLHLSYWSPTRDGEDFWLVTFTVLVLKHLSLMKPTPLRNGKVLPVLFHYQLTNATVLHFQEVIWFLFIDTLPFWRGMAIGIGKRCRRPTRHWKTLGILYM